MTDREPTREQIRELWEWCGFKRLPEGRTSYHFEHTVRIMNWLQPDGYDTPYLPYIDLNNLFKYAVPLAIDRIMAEQGCSSDLAYAILFKKWLQKLECDIPNHEETLFWAIWEAIKK